MDDTERDQRTTTTTGRATSPAPGTLHESHGRGVLRIEDRLDTSVDDLWSAVTDPARLARWYGEVSGDLRPGGRIGVHLPGPGVRQTGQVLLCEPPHRLEVGLRETEESARRGRGPAPFESRIVVELVTEGDSAVLLLEVRGLPLGHVVSYGVGWHLHVENLLAHVRGSGSVVAGARWETLTAAYTQQAAALS